MGFALLAYQGLPGVNAASFDLTNVADPDFSARNGHYIFSERYQIITLAHFEASAVRANLSAPTWNALGKMNVWPVNVSANIPTPGPPRVDERFDYPIPIPINEEVQFQVSNNLGASTEQAWGILQIGTQDWSQNIPRGQMPIMVRCTATYNPGSLVWSGPQALTFEQSLRGGVYAVVGAECQGAALIAFRLIFPRYKLAYGVRKLRPGWLCQQAVGDLIYPQQVDGPMAWGEWGRFHTFEPVQIESIMTTGASTAHEVRLWLVFLGEDVGLLNQGLGGGGLPAVMSGPGNY